MPSRGKTSPGEGFYSLITCMQVYVFSMRDEGKCLQLQWRRDACEEVAYDRIDTSRSGLQSQRLHARWICMRTEYSHARWWLRVDWAGRGDFAMETSRDRWRDKRKSLHGKGLRCWPHMLTQLDKSNILNCLRDYTKQSYVHVKVKSEGIHID